MHLIYDGMTLTKAPKNLDLRQKHAAQSIRHMWMKHQEKMDPALHTYNRCGVQVGAKGQSAIGGGLHWGWGIFIEAVDRKAQDEKGGMGRTSAPVEEGSCDVLHHWWLQEAQGVA